MSEVRAASADPAGVVSDGGQKVSSSLTSRLTLEVASETLYKV